MGGPLFLALCARNGLLANPVANVPPQLSIAAVASLVCRAHHGAAGILLHGVLLSEVPDNAKRAFAGRILVPTVYHRDGPSATSQSSKTLIIRPLDARTALPCCPMLSSRKDGDPMGWIEGLNDAMDYIEANLEGDLDLAHAARLAACTEGQFRRMFSYIAGIGLGEYVRRRRISRAALDLSRGERVVDVAVRYGYCSPTAFNRAFRDALMAGVSYLPRLLQEGLGMAAASSGAVLIPMTLALMVGSNTSGAAFRATGRLRVIAAASSAVVLAASVTFSAMSPMLAVASCTAVAAVLGLGVGIGMPVSNLAAQTGADPADAGRATSMAMFFRGFGGTVSTAACGMLAPAATAAGTAGVFGAVCVAAVAGLVASRFIPREIPS